MARMNTRMGRNVRRFIVPQNVPVMIAQRVRKLKLRGNRRTMSDGLPDCVVQVQRTPLERGARDEKNLGVTRKKICGTSFR